MLAVWPLDDALKKGANNVPHAVTVNSDNSVTCSECSKYKERGYCSHTIAVALTKGNLLIVCCNPAAKK